MSRQWHRMAEDVLMAPARGRQPVAATASGRLHPEWSVYTGENGAATSSRGKGAGKGRRKAPVSR